MSDLYRQLLDATIQHLDDLKSNGVRFVDVRPETLQALAQAPVRAATAPPPRPVSPAPAPAVKPAPIVPPVFPSPKPSPPAGGAPLLFDPPASGSVTPARGPALEPAAHAAAMAELRGRAMACVRCPNLASSRKNVVFGVGDIHAGLMFVGEAPGADEDEQAEPFVGKAGQLLTKIIQAMGFSREQVYIANILKCRPDTPGQSAGNRKPTPDEMKTCLPYLLEQIELIRPKVMVALGATAVEGLLGKTLGISKLRGNWQDFRGTPLMPTYHPAYLLRNQSLTEKRKVWEDMLQVMQRLSLPISEKQRNFFLKPTA